jgi:hypothetical protein
MQWQGLSFHATGHGETYSGSLTMWALPGMRRSPPLIQMSSQR